MVAAGYLFYNANLRIKNGTNYQYLGLSNGPPTKGQPTISSVKERAECVFKLPKKKMKNLVIVNASLSTFDLLQACVEVGEKYAENVMVIQPLLARITYALEFLSKKKALPPENEVILVITITGVFNEFVLLRRDSALQLYIAEYETNAPNQRKKAFAKYYGNYHPTSTIFIVHEDLENAINQLRDEFQPENCYIRSFQKWDYILLFGGMLRAMGDEDGYNSKYHVANFSNGYETIIQQSKTQQRRHILLPDLSPLPCKIFGLNGVSQRIKLSYCDQYHLIANEHSTTKRYAVDRPLEVCGSSKEVIAFIDARGVPFLRPPKDTVEATKIPEIQKKDVKAPALQRSSTFSKSNPSYAGIVSQTSTAALNIQPSSSVKSFQPSSSLNNPQPSSSIQISAPSRQIRFIFRDNFYAVEVYRNGITRVFANSFGKEWTPLYFSTANGTPQFGETAKDHCEKFPKHVIYDLWEVIGKPKYEIRINPNWGFELIVDNGIVHYQIETPSGTRLIPQEMVIAAFLKNMKIRVESNLDAKICEIYIFTNFKLNESQKAIFMKAAAKNDLKILSFI
uniref:Uncharacterized protein n=1 Tax=Panagrolaimus davidi TaxID=227884 RepID=A0A914PRH7_9BILA